MKKIARWSLALMLATAACGPAVDSLTLVTPAPSPRPIDHPIALLLETRPECPFQEVGTVSARKRNLWVSMEEVVEGLRRRARQMGGDAIIGIRERTETSGGTIIGSTVVADNDRVVGGTVIRFRDPNCTS